MAAARPAAEHVHDVVIVGAGPSGASCAYWLAEAGWDVVVVEHKRVPRVKTCGDGLTPRSVRQLVDMDLDAALAESHRYAACGPGVRALHRMRWPDHPNFPSYGYTITRDDLDGLVAGHAVKAGATLLQGTEVSSARCWTTRRGGSGPLPTLTGVTVKEKGFHLSTRYDQGPIRRGGRRLKLEDRAACWGTTWRRELPYGAWRCAVHYTLGAPRRPVD